MRILHLSNHCIFGNGNVHAAVDLACEQSKQGHHVFFASSGGDFEDFLETNGVSHIKITHPNKSTPWLAVSAAIEITKFCAREKIEIVHAHMMTGAILGCASTRLLRIPLVTTVHNAFDEHAILMGLGDRVIAVSTAVAKKMEKRGIHSRKIRTVLNGTLGSPRTSGPLAEIPALLRPAITTVCGLHDRKGVKCLLLAFEAVHSKHPEAHLYILGEGPQEEEYKSIAASLHSSTNIHFLGQVRDTRPYLRQTDVFVLASLQDPCPLVIPEALENGCAVVASNVDGIPEMLSEAKCGITAEPGEIEAFSLNINMLLSSSYHLENEKKMSVLNLTNFHISRVCYQTLNVYRELL